MKELIFTFLIYLSFLTSCTKSNEITIQITNPLDLSRSDEMVELDLGTIRAKLNLSDGQRFVISDANRLEIPYQITHDQKVIFLQSLNANESLSLKVKQGIPQKVSMTCCGMVYPQRFDDLAWENDLVGFRAYGPALQTKGEKAFGYDLFAKRGTHTPVLEQMYAMETDKIAWSEIRALRGVDPDAAERLRKSVTYHVDKGYGMDCYAVGPTLGAGVTALVDHDEIVYPWCYKDCQILDNGPLRFSVRLVFTPIYLNGEEIVETRKITLDAGSHLNKTSITYSNLKTPTPVVSGIVLHNKDGNMTCMPKTGFMAYEDPTTGPDQGRLYLGHVFPNKVNDMCTVYFSPEESKRRNNAKGHLLARAILHPNSVYCYYWGFGWNKADVKTYEEWINYLSNFSNRLNNPLQITFK